MQCFSFVSQCFVLKHSICLATQCVFSSIVLMFCSTAFVFCRELTLNSFFHSQWLVPTNDSWTPLGFLFEWTSAALFCNYKTLVLIMQYSFIFIRKALQQQKHHRQCTTNIISDTKPTNKQHNCILTSSITTALNKSDFGCTISWPCT